MHHAFNQFSLNNKNTTLIVSAGNSSSLMLDFPAGIHRTISVGSVSDERVWSSFSAGKCKASIGACGEKVLLTLGPENDVRYTTL